MRGKDRVGSTDRRDGTRRERRKNHPLSSCVFVLFVRLGLLNWGRKRITGLVAVLLLRETDVVRFRPIEDFEG